MTQSRAYDTDEACVGMIDEMRTLFDWSAQVDKGTGRRVCDNLEMRIEQNAHLAAQNIALREKADRMAEFAKKAFDVLGPMLAKPAYERDLEMVGEAVADALLAYGRPLSLYGKGSEAVRHNNDGATVDPAH